MTFAREALLGNVCSVAFLLTGMFAQESLLWNVCSLAFLLTGMFAQEGLLRNVCSLACLLTGMFAHRHVCSLACLLTGMFANLIFFLFSICLNIFEQVSFNFFVEISKKKFQKNFFSIF